jgi:hypothetical protein
MQKDRTQHEFLAPLTPSITKNVKPLYSVILETKKCMWVKTAWQHNTQSVCVKSFNICCISNAVEKTDNDSLWNGNEENGNVRSECEEDKG